MKRLWSSLAVVIALLVLTLWHIQAVSSQTEQISSALESAQRAAEAGDWPGAQALSEKAKAQWRSVEPWFGLVLPMGGTDEVNLAFEEMEGFLREGERSEYDSANASLLESIRHLAEAERFNLQNIL